MIGKFLRPVVAGVCAIGGVLSFTSPASAAPFIFDLTTGPGTETPASLPFSSNTVGGVTLRLLATAYHAVDRTNSINIDDVVTAKIGNYSPNGLGVLYGDDATGSNTHQIDNIQYGAEAPGVDFIALQFDRAVSLTEISRNFFQINGITVSHDDAAIYGYNSSTAFGSLNLAGTTIDESLFTLIPGTGGSVGSGKGSDSAAVNGSPAFNTFLISAAFTNRDDGFKLAGLKVNYNATPPVPEPATWAMMIVGFGAIGTLTRRRRSGIASALAA